MSVQASSQFFDALQSDAVAECLMGLGEPSQIAKVQPSECTEGRYFMLARVTGARAESYFNHRPWWERITEKQRRQEDRVAQEAIHPVVLTQPAHFSYQGSFCVPAACDEEVVGAWVAPCLAPWWNCPSRLPVVVNDTHVRLPPALAIRRTYPDFDHTWVSARPESVSPLAPRYYEFALREYRRSLNLTDKSRWLLFGSLLFVMLAGVASCTGAAVSCAPQVSWCRLASSRGPLCFDVCRVVLSTIVVLLHTLDHDNWRPIAQGSFPFYVWMMVRSLHRVNTSFAVLAVYLCLRRLSFVPRSRNLFSWLWNTLYHAIRRLVFLAPVTSIWTYVYFCFTEDVPINHLLKNHGLYIWYGQNRIQCGHPWHLWSSIFYVHEAVFRDRSMCHNISIFEGLWQLDVVVFSLVSLLGLRFAGAASALFWYPSIILEKTTLSADSLKGVGHRSLNMMPAALATCAFFAAWPPVLSSASEQLRSSVSRRTLRRKVVGLLSILCFVATAIPDIANIDWRGGGYLHEWGMRLHPDGLQYCLWGHLYELPHVAGVFMLLREWDDGSSIAGVADCSATTSRGADGDGHVLLRVLARLAGGINISNLFIIHFCAGYLHDEAMEPSLIQVLGRTFAIFLCSTVVSLFVYFTVEAPCAWIADVCYKALSLLLSVCCCKRRKRREPVAMTSLDSKTQDVQVDGEEFSQAPTSTVSEQPNGQGEAQPSPRRRNAGARTRR